MGAGRLFQGKRVVPNDASIADIGVADAGCTGDCSTAPGQRAVPNDAYVVAADLYRNQRSYSGQPFGDAAATNTFGSNRRSHPCQLDAAAADRLWGHHGCERPTGGRCRSDPWHSQQNRDG